VAGSGQFQRPGRVNNRSATGTEINGRSSATLGSKKISTLCYASAQTIDQERLPTTPFNKYDQKDSPRSSLSHLPPRFLHTHTLLICSRRRTMEPETEYYWIVLCKTHFHHLLQNRAAGHPILLGETDSVSPPPTIRKSFKARCDACGKEHSYHAHDVLRFETEPPETFVAHPLFTDF
jgi:hypothetical protein